MNENWLKYLVALSAILIAGSAAYFSVTGLGVLFSGAAIAVMVMASSLEFAKLVTATYLKQKWNEIGGLNKWYLTSAVVILMLITSAGIFGYLSNAFQQQNLALQQVDRQILVHSTKIQQNDSQIKQLSTQITESNTNQGKILDNGKVNSRLLRSVDNRDKQISKLNDRIAELQKENATENDAINKIKTDNINIEKEVGGFRFVAEAFGVELNTVVKFFIILIVIVFDPLAVALIISFNQLTMNGKKKDEEEENSTPENLKDFVDESSRLHLSDDDLKKLEEVLLNPPFPNEKLKEAAQKYSEEVREKHTHIDDFDVNQKWDGISQEVWDRMEAIEKQREAIHGPITEEDLPPTGAYANSEYRQRGELLAEIIRNDEELGLYDEPFDNPLIKEEIVNETPITREEIQFVFKEKNVDYNDDDISEWDSTLMDGLEDEPPFFTEEELQRFKEMDEMLKVYEEEYVDENIVDYKPTIEEEDENFSTIEPISENIFQEEEISQSLFDEETMEINRSEYQSYLDMEDDFDGFVPEPFATHKELEPITSEPKIDENIKTSSENEDEKKNY
jgi:hypothetical protein